MSAKGWSRREATVLLGTGIGYYHGYDKYLRTLKMPGGIGPVDPDCAQALCRGQRQVELPASADELRIFYNLSMDRVHYFPERSAIYYVDSKHIGVEQIVLSAMGRQATKAKICQLHLDRLGFFKSGKRLQLPRREAETVLVALRLKGVKVTVS